MPLAAHEAMSVAREEEMCPRRALIVGSMTIRDSVRAEAEKPPTPRTTHSPPVFFFSLNRYASAASPLL